MSHLSSRTRFLRSPLAVAALAAALMAPASAWAADVAVSSVWARASAGMSKAGAGFMTITNSGSSDDTLLSASVPATISATTELHTHIKDGEVMKMRQVENIPVPAGQTVTLKPGGLHIMFMSLNHPLVAGETFPLTLTFAHAGTIETTATVQEAGSMMPAGMSGEHHQMEKGKGEHGEMHGK